jgi:hypothetical protein
MRQRRVCEAWDEAVDDIPTQPSRLVEKEKSELTYAEKGSG